MSSRPSLPRGLVLALAAASLLAGGPLQAQPQSQTPSTGVGGLPLAIPRGALVFHGNYCGPGNRGPGLPPVDALDRACMHHDACTPSGGLPACACNDRLRREAAAVSGSPRQPQDLRSLAGFVSEFATALPCDSE